MPGQTGAKVISSYQVHIQFQLKGSYDIAKKNIILCIWCNAMCLCGLRLKKHIILHILYMIVAPPFWNASIFTKLIVLRSEVYADWPAIQCVVIGRIPQACDGNVTPLTIMWCRVPARWHKNYKTHYKRGICSIQWGHNYWLEWLILSFYALRCILHCVNITPCLHLWSEKRQTTSTTLHCSKLAFES